MSPPILYIYLCIFHIDFTFQTNIVCVFSSVQLLFLTQIKALTLSDSQQVTVYSHTLNTPFIKRKIYLCFCTISTLCLPAKTGTVCILSSVQLLSPPQSNTPNREQVLTTVSHPNTPYMRCEIYLSLNSLFAFHIPYQ